ncbi:TonB-dependent receptor [Zhongshania sp.]|uniref:TonB-dependent receptor n=1 Tax=Zhongshania sp. TaxID=1971902 RepID=UPI001B70BB85|nr:TonB-dependent receptor [Zhongshania sp.]MBQ0794882.1 TonB-dependent receptor [Zhongshania sp.]
MKQYFKLSQVVLLSTPLLVVQAVVAETMIEEVVVTAQKRSERNVDVPISINSATAEQLEQAGITDVQDLGQTVPGLRLDLSGGFSQPTIRGVGSSVAGPGLSASVATYVDGIYRASALTSAFEMADIDSVQVLKGPQGTLFGRNATGGAILITTTVPSYEPDGELKFSYGRYNDVRTTFTGSRGLTDKLAVGVSAYIHKSDGFVDNEINGEDVDTKDNWGARLKGLFEPSDTLSLLLSYAHTDRDDGSPNALNAYEGRALVNDPDAPTAGFPGAPTVSELNGGQAYDKPVYTKRGSIASDAELGFTAETDDITLKIEKDFDNMVLTSYTGYHDETVVYQQDYDLSDLPIFHGHFQVEGESFSQELNLTSTGSDRLQWVVGAYYFKDDTQFPFFNAVQGGFSAPNAFANGQKTEAVAIFVDGSYDLTDLLTLTLGARYSEDTMRVNFESVPNGIPYTEAEETFEKFSPRAVLRYSLDDDSSVYASVTEGYKSGVFNAAGFSTIPVDPEEILAYEIGYKTQRNQWSADLAAFYYDYSELQVNRFVGAGSVLVNAAEATIYGVDSQLGYAFNERLRADLNVAYTKSEYDDFKNAPAYLGTGNPGDPYGTGDVDATGNDLLRTPELTANLSLNYERPFKDGLLALNSSYYYSSKFYFDATNDTHQDAYGLLNVRASWTPASDSYTVAVYANNVTDEEYLVQVLGQSAGMLQQYGSPATYGVSLAVRF